METRSSKRSQILTTSSSYIGLLENLIHYQCRINPTKTNSLINFIRPKRCFTYWRFRYCQNFFSFNVGFKVDSTVQLFKRINFSSATSPGLFQASIEQECDNKMGKDYGPPQNKQLAIFIDDMSMPFVNKWGDQVTL